MKMYKNVPVNEVQFESIKKKIFNRYLHFVNRKNSQERHRISFGDL